MINEEQGAALAAGQVVLEKAGGGGRAETTGEDGAQHLCAEGLGIFWILRIGSPKGGLGDTGSSGFV